MKVAFGSVSLDVNVSPRECERAKRSSTAADSGADMASCRLFRNILLFALVMGALSGALGSCMLIMAAQSPTFSVSNTSILLASLLAVAGIFAFVLMKRMVDFANSSKAEAETAQAAPSAKAVEVEAETEIHSNVAAAESAQEAEPSETPSSEILETPATARTVTAAEFHAMSGSRAPKEIELDEAAFPPADAFTGACRTMAHRYLLSRRQTEVFYLLARGHNAAAIQTKLCISNSTAKSHISDVYKKLGIHTQRELLRMVEEAIEEVA